MRVVIESKHTLVVEKPGPLMPLLALVLIALHLTLFVPQVREAFELSNTATAVALILVSLAIYAVLGYLCFGPNRDRTIITFQGEKSRLLIERKMPFGLSSDTEIPFSDFDRFEIASAAAGGFCRLCMKDGSVRRLLRVKSDDEFELMQRLPLITRKDVKTIRSKEDNAA